MIKRVLIVIVAALAGVCCCRSQTVAAEGVGRSFSWGPRVSFDVAIPGGSHGMYGAGAGINGGLGMSLPIDKGFSFDPEILLFYNTLGTDYMRQDGAVYNGSVRNVGLRFPLMVGYHFGVSQGVEMSVATGPWINVNITAREHASPNFAAPEIEPASSINLFPNGFKRVEALWGLKLSATFAQCYTVAITTGVGFTPMAVYGDRDNKIKIRRYTLAISLGYNF